MDKWISNNTAAKLIALAISILLWAMVHMDTGSPAPPTISYDTKSIDVKIQTYGFDDTKYALTGISTDTVTLKIKGKKSDMTSVFADDYKVKLDLSNVNRPGTHTLPLTYSLPTGVELVSMEPNVVTVTVEERVSQSVPVTIDTKGEVNPDYRLGVPIQVDPGSVNVTLPESEQAQLSEVRGTVNLDGAKETITDKKVKLVAYDKEGNIMEDAVIEPASVAVNVPIETAFVKVPLDIEYTGRLPDDLVLSKVTPKVTEVKLYGSKDALAGVDFSIKATVNLDNVTKPGVTVLTANLVTPEGFEKIEPSTVQVEVNAESYSEREITGIPISLKGVPSGMEAVITEPKSQSMSMTVTGAPDLLNSLQPSDIVLTANLARLKAGVHDVPLQITLPRYVNRVDQNPLVIKVELTPTEVPVTGKPKPPVTNPDPGGEEEKPPKPPKPPEEEHQPGAGNGSDSEQDNTDHDSKKPPAEDG